MLKTLDIYLMNVEIRGFVLNFSAITYIILCIFNDYFTFTKIDITLHFLKVNWFDSFIRILGLENSISLLINKVNIYDFILGFWWWIDFTVTVVDDFWVDEEDNIAFTALLSWIT